MTLFTCSCAAKESAKKVVWLGYHENSSAIYPTVHYDFQLEEDGTYTLIKVIFKKTEGIESIPNSEVRSQKIIRDGRLYLKYNGTVYDAQGRKLIDN